MGFFKRDGKRVEPWKPESRRNPSPAPAEEPIVEPEKLTEECFERMRREAVMVRCDAYYKKSVFEHFNDFRNQFSKNNWFNQDIEASWNDEKLLPSVGHALSPLIKQIDDKRIGMVVNDLEAVIKEVKGSLKIFVPHFNGDISKYREVSHQIEKELSNIPDQPNGLDTYNIYDRKTRKHRVVWAKPKRVDLVVDQEIVLKLKESSSFDLIGCDWARRRRVENEETLNFFCDIYCYEIEFIIEEKTSFTQEDDPDRTLLGNMFEELIQRGLKMKSVGFARDQYDIKLDWQGTGVHLIILPRPKNELFNIEPTFIPNHKIQPNNFTLFPGVDVTHTHCTDNEYVNYCRFTEKKD